MTKKYQNLGVRPTGSMGEYATLMLLPCARLCRKKSHDIRVNKTYIEVKAARARKANADWTFNLRTAQKRWAPVFAFVCFSNGDDFKIERFYLVRKQELLGKKSVYIKNGEFENFRVY